MIATQVQQPGVEGEARYYQQPRPQPGVGEGVRCCQQPSPQQAVAAARMHYLAATAVALAWFDWMPPMVMTQSWPLCTASARRNSSLRTCMQRRGAGGGGVRW